MNTAMQGEGGADGMGMGMGIMEGGPGGPGGAPPGAQVLRLSEEEMATVAGMGFDRRGSAGLPCL